MEMSQKKKEIILPPAYLHQLDVRSDKEKILSDNIVRSLSELNLGRVKSRSEDNLEYSNKYFFLCLTGIPAFPNEFENLQLPGQKILYSLSGYVGNYSHEDHMRIIAQVSLEEEAKNISKIINSVPQDRKIVIVFHSFGGFIASAYFHLYGHSKIFGLIDIGSIPVTMYEVLKSILIQFLPAPKFETLIENADLIYKNYAQYAKSEKFTPLENKYQLLIFLKVITSKTYEVVFEWARNYPDVLKLILSGRKDIFFPEPLLSEKAIHYSYRKKMRTQYEESLKKAYTKLYGIEVANVQQRFIFSFENGRHSLHVQQVLVPDLKNAIKQYLKVLDLAGSQVQPSK